MTPVEVIRGDGPVVLAMPHTGTHVPADILARLTPAGRTLADTDWHIDRLYDRLLPGATVVRATFHRYVIDANRPPSGESLYPGQNTTGLVPLTGFDGAPLWTDPPTDAEIEARRRDWHAPYHAALAVAAAVFDQGGDPFHQAFGEARQRVGREILEFADVDHGFEHRLVRPHVGTADDVDAEDLDVLHCCSRPRASPAFHEMDTARRTAPSVRG